MKILISYNSETGNTEKIAFAIKEELGDEVEIMKTSEIKDSNDLVKYDHIIFGFFVDKGYPDEVTMAILPKIHDKKVSFFSTLGAYPYSLQASRVFVRAADTLGEDCRVEGTFICQGRVSDESLEKIKTLPPDDPKRSPKSNLRREIGMTHPDEEDLKNAKIRFRQIIKRDI